MRLVSNRWLQHEEGGMYTNLHGWFFEERVLFHSFFCVQILIDLSSEPDAIKFSVGWQATFMTGSVWPSSFWSSFLEFNSHMYTQLSSDPLTIRFPFVTENAEEMQYCEFVWPVYVLRNLADEMFHNLCTFEYRREISALINESWESTSSPISYRCK